MTNPDRASQSPTGATNRKGPLRAGERVQLTDARGKLNTITLIPGEGFHTQYGVLNHDDLIGGPEGVVVENSHGYRYQVLRPLLNDFVLSMPRGATVVYPKDAGQIIQLADIFPGAHVVEAGVGSGALSISLLRAIGDHGLLTSYERREDFAEIARGNVETFFGQPHPGFRIELGDVQSRALEVHEPGSVDRVVLDMLAPWECVDTVATILRPGGVWLNYVATVTQLSRVAEAIKESGKFTATQASETIVREWHLDGLAVRPEHRMIGHTGFLLTTRRLATDQQALALKKRDKSEKFSEEDKQLWTPSEDSAWRPEQHGNREPTSKRARKSARQAVSYAHHASSASQSAKTHAEE